MADRCLLTIHAHPDDEASKGAPTVARYGREGVRTVLVCATGGEAGDILNPAMDRPEVRDRLTEVRAEELAASAAAIGFDEVILMGYRDSGMPDTPPNRHPNAFANVPFLEAVQRLVGIIRAHRPDVIITYADDQQGYQHPDHLRVHDITLPAFDLAGIATAFPDAGTPWAPKKLYYSMWSRRRMLATHMKMQELELESPFDERWFSRPSMDHRLTTRIDIHDTFSVRSEALLAHRTQVDPESPFWFGLPDDIAREVYPYEDYILARTRVSTAEPEHDLFAGIS
ncbi:MAG: mycothiol conjugate amidase Mca [Acidimicrobiales bacterium]